MNNITNTQPEFVKVINHFRQDIATLKTGRANPAIFDGVRVESYGAMMPLNQLASISVPEARSIIIAPWDKNVLKDIERALRESDLNLNPVNEGDKIRISIPAMTEESRRGIVKILNQKMEQARIAIRGVRDDIKEQILEAEKNKEFGEDMKYQLIEDLDKVTTNFNDEIKTIGEEKEQEIMTI
jgi:ribosome recycling factor